MAKIDVFKSIGNFVATMSIIVGIVITVLNFRMAKEAEAESRKIEAAKPFLEMRQQLYLEALKNASVLASQNFHTTAEVDSARKRFAELYWGELSLVEENEIEIQMFYIAQAENMFPPKNKTQDATLTLARKMRESLRKSWDVDTLTVGKVKQ